MEKVIRDGKVAVLVSRGYGAGWYTWRGNCEALLFHPKLVQLVEQNNRHLITKELVKEITGEDMYVGGVDQLSIEWIDVGTCFRITEYDGAEDLEIIGNLDYIVA